MANGSLRALLRRLPVDPDARGRDDERVVPVGAAAALVAVGGGVGALLRGALELQHHRPGGWPWATLGINVSGAFVLGGLLILLEELFPSARVARPLIGTGFLGGYTTFSTFAVESFDLLHAHRAGLAMAYVASSTVGALFAVLLGVVLGRAVSRLLGPRRRLRTFRRAPSGGPS